MVLQVVAGLFVLFVFNGLARRISSGQAARGGWWNFWETLALYIRDNVVRPTIGDGEHHGHGEHGTMSMVATIMRTRRLRGHHDSSPPGRQVSALCLDVFFLRSGLQSARCFSLAGFADRRNQRDGSTCRGHGGDGHHLRIAANRASPASGCRWRPVWIFHPGMKLILVPVIWLIEFAGFVIKHGVLAIRLFANMMGGHTVVAVIMLFIAMAAHSSSIGCTTSSCRPAFSARSSSGTLELLFAFVQAYIFAFLATLFIGMAVHPH